MAGPAGPAGLAVLAFALVGAPGCYYTHLARGQLSLLFARQPVEEVTAAPETSDPLRHQLELSQDVRVFARGGDPVPDPLRS